jgi:hypothetical protein
MIKILNLNKQTIFWRLKQHLNSFTKLVTFQSSIIRVYLNLCVHQFLVSFLEKYLYSPMICLADWPIVVHFVVLSFLCHIWTYYCRLSPGTVGCLSVLFFLFSVIFGPTIVGFPLVLLVVCRYCHFAVWFSVSISVI